MPTAKILVVDDNADFRETVLLALERAGYFVMEAENGRRALEIIDRLQPDLVLLDVNMPVMSGPEFVEELRQRGEVHPFGVVTMSGTIHAQSSPTTWFLPKPLELNLLLSVAADFCGRRATSTFWVQEQQRESLDALAGILQSA